MKRAFVMEIKFNKLQLDIIEELSLHTTKLYNIANYDNIQNGFNSFYDMNNKYKSEYHAQFLHSHTYQNCLQVLEKNWKSYFVAKKDYDKNKSKYKGEPRQPKYKNIDNKKNEVIFTKYAIRFRNNILILSISKKIQEIYKVKSINIVISDKLQSLVKFNALQQIKFKYDRVYKKWIMIAIYIKEQESISSDSNNTVAIDLGLNNLVACTNLQNNNVLLINGKPVKSKNRYINNKISILQSLQMKKTKNKLYKNTKQILKLKECRKNYIKDYLHKTSKQVIEYAITNKANKIVIGDIKNIKQNMNYNKNFVQIPIQDLSNYIEYKAEEKGIEIIKIKENYTSGVSSIDNEEINKTNYNKKRRIKRGLFKTNTGIIINADINGSLNILRKYTNSIPKLCETIMDKGHTGVLVKSMVS